MKNIELMSPAGSFESLYAAVNAGANAVYFGVDRLNMRSRSSGNFSIADMDEISEVCRKSGVKSCITVNSVLYDEDTGVMKEIITEAKKKNISAVIVSDVAAMEFANKIGMGVHISTQMNIGNSHSVKFYSQFADVIVLARELNLDQVRNIADTIDKENITGPSGERVKLEVFIHGALCMAISGKCYLSLHETGYSANRGACMQLCRRAYHVKDKESDTELEIDHEYIMSPKDLCTIHFLNKIVDAGVTVLKIEGRARSPEYVKTVTETYSEALSAIKSGEYNIGRIEKWKERLGTVFNRGFWDGYYLGQRLGEWSNVYGSKSTKTKVYLGKAVNYFDKIGVAEFLIETGTLEEGDELLITGQRTGVLNLTPGEIRNDFGRVVKISKGEKAAFKVPSEIRRSDKLYKIVDRN